MIDPITIKEINEALKMEGSNTQISEFDLVTKAILFVINKRLFEIKKLLLPLE